MDEEINALCIRFLNNFFVVVGVFFLVFLFFSPEEAYTQCSITIFITLSPCLPSCRADRAAEKTCGARD